MQDTRINTNLIDIGVPNNGGGLPEVPVFTTGHGVTEDVFNAGLSRCGLDRSRILLELEEHRKENKKLRLLAQKIAQDAINAMENDRKAVARELHDGIGGSLSAIKFFMEMGMDSADVSSCESAKSMEQIIGYLKDTIKETSTICHQLNSRALEGVELAVAISKLIRRFNQFFPKIEVVIEIGLFDEVISEKVKTVIYRVVQEALNNIGKHSGADVVKIKLIALHNQILLKVEDNGCGFDIRVLEADPSHQGFGMRSMKDRIELCEGTFQVRSKPGKGTKLSATIPIR